ncbi:MAG: nickel pincer cofactor biosynthesis protein LarC [Candidatus Choladocola sp.]|nr:nickel pincer cofactor biosynthesis protein LarC [Candidatus Choladocola sp.]
MNETVLYLECSSGISGDMTVAALLDLGADRQVLMDALESLPLSGYSIEIKEVFKSGIRACDFHVILDAGHENHDHDMEYLHGHAAQNIRHGQDHHHSQEHDLGQDHHHSQEHNLGQEHSHHHDHHADARNLNDIISIIQSGTLSDGAQELAIRIFRILAEAEASVHGTTIEKIHFHEVGAVDSIVDIVSAAVCIDNLHPDRIVVSPLTDGRGQIRCQHGLIPVPVPAVTAIAAAHSLSLKISDIDGELVTPTGAAIAAAVQSRDTLPEEFQIIKTGLGAGKRSYATTGLLRAMLLRIPESDTSDTILTLETNVDDCTGEALSFTMQLLMDAGALDVFYQPIYMKKNRPACLLKVICEPQLRSRMESIIFRNTTTIGIRVQKMQRTKLKRRILAIETPWGMADVKCCTHGNETYYYPENDSICRLALLHEIGFPEMYSMVQSYAREKEIELL